MSKQMYHYTANGIDYNIGDEGQIEFEHKTIDVFLKLHKEIVEFDTEPFGLFWAFSDEEFEKGLDNLKSKGIFKPGDKLAPIDGGGFIIKSKIQAYKDVLNSYRKKIAEQVNPQELYFYQYNNHEAMYYDDRDAYSYVVDTYGKDVAKTIVRLRRALD